MRIATVYTDGTSNAHYRALLPLRELERRGHRVLWPARYPPAKLLAGAPTYDVLLLHQFFHADDIALAHRLRGEGVAVVWDSDDDVLAIPRYSPAFKNYGGRRGIKKTYARTVEIARAASLMTTPSAHLAERYRQEGVEHAMTIENCVAPEDVARRRSRHQGVVVGLVAAYEHNEDLERLRIAQVLERLLGAHDGVRVVTYGPDLKLRSPRYEYRGIVPIKDLITAELEFDVGLAPLTPSPFALARSNVKVKEYAAAGAMWLASPVGPFVGLGEEQGGLLVDDGDWYDVLDRLVQDYRRRGELMERARAWARRDSADHAAGRWEAAFRGALQRVRSRAA